MRRKRVWSIAVLCLVLLTGFASRDAGAQQTANPNEPDPVVLLKQMCDYIKSIKEFSYQAEVLDDQVYQGGKKLEYGLDMETYVKRPDKLRVNAVGDVVDKQFFFNGKTITLYDRDKKVYGTMDVPPDIEGALDKAHKEFNVRVALTDLASPVLWDHISTKIQHALYVGMSNVRGVPCHHLAFDSENVHLQLWIEAGKKPFRRKVVFVQKKIEGEPQWIAYLSGWKTTAHYPDALFNFVVPSGVQKINFVPAKQPASPEKPKGDKS